MSSVGYQWLSVTVMSWEGMPTVKESAVKGASAHTVSNVMARVVKARSTAGAGSGPTTRTEKLQKHSGKKK